MPDAPLATLAVDTIPVGEAFGLALSPDGTQLWVSRSLAGSVAVFATATRAFLGGVLTGGSPRHIAFAADGTVLIANDGGDAQVVRPSGR